MLVQVLLCQEHVINKLLIHDVLLAYTLYKFRERLSLIFFNSISVYASIPNTFFIRWLKRYTVTGPLYINKFELEKMSLCQ